MEDDVLESDDIAYVGTDDDERGPGCLVAIAGVIGLLGLVSFSVSLIWMIVLGSFEANRQQAANIGNPFFYILNFFMMGFALLAGGFSLGLGLFSASRAKLSNRPDFYSLWGLISALGGAIAVFGVVITIAILVGVHGLIR